MPELIRSVVSRMRLFVKDRRRAPRFRTRLLFSISVSRNSKTNGSLSRERILKGHTKDISVSGLGLMLPQVHLDGHHLATEGRELHLTLELPGGVIPITVVPARYEHLDESELGCGYLIGVRILEISDEDRSRMESFITHGLSRNGGRELAIT